MLTDSVKRDVTLRLHKAIVKNTTMAGYYWDPLLQKFVSLQTYHNWTWLASYYVGQMLQISFALYLYICNEFNNQLPDVSVTTSMENQHGNKNLLVLVGFALWIVITQLLAAGSVAVEYRSEMIEGMNQIFALDKELKHRFRNAHSEMTKMTRNLAKIICWVTILIPILFLPIWFHPDNPLRGFIEAVIEIPTTTDSSTGWVFVILQTCVAFCLLGQLYVSLS